MSDFSPFSSTPLEKVRQVKNIAWKIVISIGGISIIALVMTMFVFLFKQALPLFANAKLEPLDSYSISGPILPSGDTLYMDIDEQNQISFILTDQNEGVFFDIKTGRLIGYYTNEEEPKQINPISINQSEIQNENELNNREENSKVTLIANNGINKPEVALVRRDNSVVVYKPEFSSSYVNGTLQVNPDLIRLFPDRSFVFEGVPQSIAFRFNSERLIFIAKTEKEGEINLEILNYIIKENFITGDLTLEEEPIQIKSPIEFDYILVDELLKWVYFVSKNGNIDVFNLNEQGDELVFVRNSSLFDRLGDEHANVPRQIVNVEFLLGEASIIAIDNQGIVYQAAMTRQSAGHFTLEVFRHFTVDISDKYFLMFSQGKKDFAVVDQLNHINYFNTTSEKHSLDSNLFNDFFEKPSGLTIAALSPKSDLLLLEDNKKIYYTFSLDNHHSDVSIKSLWQEVWYENYPEPDYVWQSTSANDDYEPKLSLIPLIIGTLKAAFYALIVAIPIAVTSAIYTAYFMKPELRRIIKPSIELIEAFPTVIIGLLAAFFLAPLVENFLLHFFIGIIFFPISVILLAWVIDIFPIRKVSKRIEGNYPIVLLPLIILYFFLVSLIGDGISSVFFDNSLRTWLILNYDIAWNQYNGIVIGIALGFATIPIIFSITEDAIFTVPRSLSYGSFALGANSWQTLIRVVLPSASPAIFSAVMIGMGRAVGETMIILMASGNTPLTEWNLFNGMRTLSANLAIEIPESVAQSSHYRILFLSGLVLFVFTFLFNTLAEFIRQSLHNKYRNL